MWPKTLLTILLLRLAGCGDGSGDPVHIVVPTGFQGAIQIVVDGTDSGGYRHVNGRHEYTVPADGVLHVKSSRPFERWHTSSASDAAGKAIELRPSAHAGQPHTSTAEAPIICVLGSRTTNSGPPVHWYAVGKPEYVARVEKWFYSGSGSPPIPTSQPAT